MELNWSHFKFTSSTPRGPATERMQPRHLEYVSAGLDVVLFGIALIVAGLAADKARNDLFDLAQTLACVLLLVLFLGGCRVAKIHDAKKLLTGSRASQLLAVVACFCIPPALVMLLCLPTLGDDPAVSRIVAWLRDVTFMAAGLAVVSRTVLFATRSKISSTLVSPQRIAIVGSGEAARRLLSWVGTSSSPLIDVIGVFEDRNIERLGDSEVADRVRGNTADLINLYKQAPFDKIVIALPHSAEDRLLSLLRRLRQLPVDIVLAPDLIGFRATHRSPAKLAGLPLYALADRPIREPQRLIKGAIDRTLAALALVALSPLLLVVSLAIKLDSRGAVLFRQPRQGLGDTMFEVFKFRTMGQDLGDTAGHQQTRRQDPRVTRIGGFLRRSSIDELPQLLNVLRGEMSLVGPRPHTPHMLIGDKRIFDLVDEYSFRHRVKPGITGLAQVSGYRGAIDTPEQLRARIEFDLYYIDHWSLWLDFKIICRTAMICVSGANAF